MISQNAYINDCYNIGKIFTHVVSKSTNHIARSMAGGVYGRLASGTVSNCYAIKDIEVIKENGISISSTASNIITKTQNLYYIDGENWQEMLTKSSFLGFDFESIWTFNDNSEYQFPVLKDVQMIFEKKIKSISITQMPSKCIFIKNKDFLDTSNGTITLMYNNFTQEGIPLLNSMVFGYDNTKIGKQTLTVNYLGLVCEYEINIIDHAKNVEFVVI